MKKHIVEDLPARNYPQSQSQGPAKKPMSGGSSTQGKDKERGGDGGEKTPEQRIRQAVYDIRYRARRENLPLRTAYSQYMQNSSMSEMEKAEVRSKLFGKEGGSGGGVQAESFKSYIKETASTSIAKALYRVFVDNKPKITEEYIDSLKNNFKESSETPEGKKYKVRVSDPQSGVTYVRYATREKISQLRGRGLEVEMTEYGDPYEGEKERGEDTANVSRDRSRAKRDYDGDGEIESGSKEHAGVVHNAIQKKKGLPPDGKDTSNIKEGYLDEILGMANLPQLDSAEYANPDANPAVIDVLPPDKKNKVTVNPSTNIMAHNDLSGYGKFLNLLNEKKMTKAKRAKEKRLKQKYDDSSMKSNMEKEYGPEKGKKIYFAKIRKEAMKEECDCEDENKEKELNCSDDSRSLPTTISLAKAKMRSKGIKDPVLMAASYEPEGEVIDERRREDKGKPRPDTSSIEHQVMMAVRSQNEDGLMTRSGGTVAQHKKKRGVKKDRTSPVTPKPPVVTPADKVAAKKAAAVRRREETEKMYKPRAGESD